MLKIVALFAFAVHQISAGAVELLPAAQVAPIAQAVVTARSSQYFAQNHNAFAAPLVAPVAPIAPYVAPVTASVNQVARYAEPVAQYIAPAVARYIAPASSSYSQVTRYASPIVQYTAPLNQYIAAARLVQPNVAVSPLIARAPLAVASPQPIAVAQPVPIAQPVGVTQPIGVGQPVPVAPQQPATPALNPDDESIEIESARVRTLPQARNQQQLESGAQQQRTPVTRFQSFPQPSLALAQQNLIARYQQQGDQNGRFSAAPITQARNQQSQGNAEVSGRNVAQQQKVLPRNNGALVAAPGLLSAQQYVQGAYFV